MEGYEFDVLGALSHDVLPQVLREQEQYFLVIFFNLLL